MKKSKRSTKLRESLTLEYEVTGQEKRTVPVPSEEWEWMPHPAHHMMAWKCRFRMATRVGNVIVSTVGELPDPLHPGELGAIFSGGGESYEFETMVFPVDPKKKDLDCGCAGKIIPGLDLQATTYHDARSAMRGHYDACWKWAGIDVTVAKKKKGKV